MFVTHSQVILGALFRGYRALLGACGLTGVQCFTITRGYGQPPVQSCTGRLLCMSGCCVWVGAVWIDRLLYMEWVEHAPIGYCVWSGLSMHW